MVGASLVNVSGGVVGIYVHPSPSEGFVLPMRRAIDIAETLKANPTMEAQAWAGLELQELTEDLKEYFGAANGVLISSTEPEGPAAQAGLRPMDVIERIGDVEVTSPAAVVQVITQSMPGTRLILGIRRNSRQQRIELTVSQAPGTETSLSPAEGLLAMRLRLNVRGNDGLEIVSVYPQSDANILGVKAGDIILTVDGRRVLRPEQFWSYQRTFSDRKVQLWSVQRGSKHFFVAVKQRVGQL
jgi:serine protease Do